MMGTIPRQEILGMRSPEMSRELMNERMSVVQETESRLEDLSQRVQKMLRGQVLNG